MRAVLQRWEVPVTSGEITQEDVDDAIRNAKAVNLPVDTVKRNIDKATGAYCRLLEALLEHEIAEREARRPLRERSHGRS